MCIGPLSLAETRSNLENSTWNMGKFGVKSSGVGWGGFTSLSPRGSSS